MMHSIALRLVPAVYERFHRSRNATLPLITQYLAPGPGPTQRLCAAERVGPESPGVQSVPLCDSTCHVIIRMWPKSARQDSLARHSAPSCSPDSAEYIQCCFCIPWGFLALDPTVSRVLAAHRASPATEHGVHAVAAAGSTRSSSSNDVEPVGPYLPPNHPDEVLPRSLGGDGTTEVDALWGDKVCSACAPARQLHVMELYTNEHEMRGEVWVAKGREA